MAKCKVLTESAVKG